MSDNTPRLRQISLLGGVGSGKSTWLGALLDGLDGGRSPALTVEKLPEDTSGVNELTDPILDGRFPQRTELSHKSPVEIQLGTHHPLLKRENFNLGLSDYSGEELDILFSDRAGWSSQWKRRAQSDVLLVFVRPSVAVAIPRLLVGKTPDDAARWQHLKEPTAGGRSLPPLGPVQKLPRPPASEAADIEVARPGDPVKVPTSLELVEIIQFIRHGRGLAPGELPPPGSLRVVLVITAWDMLPPQVQARGPAEILADTVPLLEEYIQTNFNPLDVFRFGLSAVGGDLNNPTYSESFRDNPQGYVTWVDVGGHIQRANDIALPLYWGLFGEVAWRLI